MNKTTKRLTVIIGIIMTVAMVGSLILPLISGQVAQSDAYSQTPQPTRRPDPTPPPPPDTSAIDFDQQYLHPSGLFTVAAPTGWSTASNSNTADELRASLSNSDVQSVVEARIIKNHSEINDADGLSAFFDRSWLDQSWREYPSWDETSRKIADDGKLVIDFNLRRSRNYLIARQEAWIQDGEIYSVRVITAENAPQELKYLLQGVAKSVSRIGFYMDAPYEWQAYFDNVDKHMVRFPENWEVTDAADGLPATIISDDAIMVVETHDVALRGEADAIHWIEASRDGLQSRTVEPVEVSGAPGYLISYGFTTIDGAPASGLALVLNGTDNRLHVANGRIGDLDVDLLGVDASEYSLRAILDSFRLLPELNALTEPRADDSL